LYVRIYIIDFLGTVVQSIISVPQEKGIYKKYFNTSGWASGIYFCIVQIEGVDVATKKFIVQ